MLRALVDDLGITVLVVTHDLDTLLTVADRVIVLAHGKVLADGTAAEVMAVDDEWIRRYFALRRMTGGNTADGS
jgi:phospholipid/cholesterol/gamma-HCH transport system ATP-binding protein